MKNVHLLWLYAKVHLIGQSMGTVRLALVLHKSVPILILACLPYPAASVIHFVFVFETHINSSSDHDGSFLLGHVVTLLTM
jgi:hypothetical protein